MSKDKATPRPWAIRYPGAFNYSIIDNELSEVCFIKGEYPDFEQSEEHEEAHKANAELIVRAVNSHDKLVEAASNLLKAIEQKQFYVTGYTNGSASISEAKHAMAEEDKAYSVLWNLIKEIKP